MLDLLIISIVVFFMSFIGEAKVPADAIAGAVQVCADHKGLKQLNSAYFFNKSTYTAYCTNGVEITLPTRKA